MIAALKATGRLRLFTLLAVSMLFSLCLLAGRLLMSHTITYLFLTWNLFLAFIPFAISTSFQLWPRLHQNKLVFCLLFLPWLLFLPNSPYILTDLFHLQSRPPVPKWYDLILLLSFAWNGLSLFFISLIDVQAIIMQKTKAWMGWALSGLIMLASGFGIYLGRFLRWNSWDILTNPHGLLYDIADRFLNPFAHPRTWGMTLAFGFFLMFSYLIFRELAHFRQQQRIGN